VHRASIDDQLDSFEVPFSVFRVSSLTHFQSNHSMFLHICWISFDPMFCAAGDVSIISSVIIGVLHNRLRTSGKFVANRYRFCRFGMCGMTHVSSGLDDRDKLSNPSGIVPCDMFRILFPFKFSLFRLIKSPSAGISRMRLLLMESSTRVSFHCSICLGISVNAFTLAINTRSGWSGKTSV